MNFDGLIGPTHNYAGLSFGNVASSAHGGGVSHPRAAALQGLAKMEAVAALGLPQGFLPPLARPAPHVLRELGFEGDDDSVLAQAARHDPVLLAQVCSASCMWTANAATVTPSCESHAGRVHLTPANLRAQFHRSIEPPETATLLKAIFPGEAFVHHPPLPASDQFGDEGAANHTRLATDEGVVHLFVHGVEQRRANAPGPRRFPARQTLEASQAVARMHGLRDDQVVMAQQHPDVIDEGVFHNDVISVGTGNVLLYHERAFLDGDSVIDQLRDRLGSDFLPLQVTQEDLPVRQCVSTYLFNSQLLELDEGSMVLVMPIECESDEQVGRVCQRWCASDTPINRVITMDVRESMRNGGGPACLRLRVPLNEAERAMVHPGVVLTPDRAESLRAWITRWYPESLHPGDLADPTLLHRSREALEALTQLLGLGPVYPFQQG
jgi:succinylarginine dihydrolase